MSEVLEDKATSLKVYYDLSWDKSDQEYEQETAKKFKKMMMDMFYIIVEYSPRSDYEKFGERWLKMLNEQIQAPV